MYKLRITQFYWGDRPTRLSYGRLVQNTDLLGLKLVDLWTKMWALQAMWPVRWAERLEKIRWFYYSFPIKDRRSWLCNTSPKDIDKIYSPRHALSSALSIWYSWSKRNFRHADEIDTIEEILDQKLWGNSLIRVKGKPVFDKKQVNSNIDSILNIYNATTKEFLTYQQLVQAYGQVILIMSYNSILSAIPRTWKVILRREELTQEIDIEPLYFMLAKLRHPSRAIYWFLIESKFPG